MIRITSNRDLLAGLMFTAIGVIGVWLAKDYSFGQATRMGPGFLPVVLSSCTAVLGCCIALRALRVQATPLESVGGRPLLLILCGITVFGLLIEGAGLVAAVVSTVFVGGMATRDARLVNLALVAIGVTVFCVSVFVWALNQPIPVWPR